MTATLLTSIDVDNLVLAVARAEAVGAELATCPAAHVSGRIRTLLIPSVEGCA
jgi:hypothetical protein